MNEISDAGPATCREFALPRDGGRAEIPCYEWRGPSPPTLTIIAVHGLGDHGRALPYQRLAAAMLPNGWRVISYDQRGHGSASARSWADVRLPGLLHDLRAVSRYAGDGDVGGPLVVVGLSMGALVTILACAEEPTLADGVVLASAPLGAVTAGRAAVVAATVLGGVVPGLRLETGIDATNITDNRDDLAAYVRDPRFQTRVGLGLAADLLGAAKEARQRARQLRTPALFLHGRLDRIAPWGDEVAADLQGAERAVRILEHGYHNLFLDVRRRDVFDTIAQWCSSLVR